MAPVRSILLLFLLLGACRPTREWGSIEGLTIVAQRQTVSERNWEEVSLRELFVMPREPDVLLLTAGPIEVDAQGYMYIMDVGDMTIKRFDPNGHYVAAYGGRGEGPGEFNIFSDMGFVGDSILYVVIDRILSFFGLACTGTVVF